MKKIVIIGANGHVGGAMARFFAGHYETMLFDPTYEPPGPDKGSCPAVIYHDKEKANTADVAVVCVPTAEMPNGRCDVSIVEEVISWLKTPLIILKSTVEPGTTDRLTEKYGKRIVFSPEYIGMSSYASPYRWDTEVKETPWFTFGGSKDDTRECVELYVPICGPAKQYVQTEAKVAELAKYMENVFYAMKVTFCYEMAAIASKMGVDYNELREVWLMDPRISKYHTSVFATNKKPYGGRCVLPDAKVKCSTGEIKTIESLFFEQKKSKFCIESCDSKISRHEFKTVSGVTRREVNEELIRFVTDPGIFKCTKEHLMPVFRDGKIVVVQAQEILDSDSLCSLANSVKIKSIDKFNYSGHVYNLELDSSSPEDDLFWVEQNTGIVTHNCYPKDLAALISYSNEVLGYDPKLLREIANSNERIGKLRESEAS